MPIQPLQFLALGDSYTIGTGVPLGESWPHQLTGMIENKGITILEPVIIAKRGWSSLDLIQALDRYPPSGQYDLVTLLIGVNDQYGGIKLEYYRENFNTLLDLSIKFSRSAALSVLVLSIPDWSVTPHAQNYSHDQIKQELKQFNQLNESAAKDRGVAYLDLTPQSREAAHNPDLLTGDGLHPSGLMYKTWAELVLPPALAVINYKDDFA